MNDEAIKKIIIGEINALTAELSTLSTQLGRIESASGRVKNTSSYCEGFIRKQLNEYGNQQRVIDDRVAFIHIELEILRNHQDPRHVQKINDLDEAMDAKRAENEVKRGIDRENKLKHIEQQREKKEKHKIETAEKREKQQREKEERDRIRYGRRGRGRGRGRRG